MNTTLLYYELLVEDAGIPTKLGLNYSFVACEDTGWFKIIAAFSYFPIDLLIGNKIGNVYILIGLPKIFHADPSK